MMQRSYSAEQYLEEEPRVAARVASALPARAQLRLAVELSARKAWHEPGAVYNFWLQLWHGVTRETSEIAAVEQPSVKKRKRVSAEQMQLF